MAKKPAHQSTLADAVAALVASGMVQGRAITAVARTHGIPRDELEAAIVPTKE